MYKKKIVLTYNNNLNDNIILKWLNEKNFEIIIFVTNFDNENYNNLKKKLFFLNIKKIYFKKLKIDLIKNYFFPVLRCVNNFNFFINLKNNLKKFLIIKELTKISFYEKTNFIISNNLNNEKENFFFFNKNIKIINPWKNFNTKFKKEISLYFSDYFIKKKNKKNNLNFNINYPIYLNLTFKKGDLTKINNIEYNYEDLISILNKVGFLTGIKEDFFFKIKNKEFKNFAFYIIYFLKKKLEKKIFKYNLLKIKNELTFYYENILNNNLWWSIDRLFLQNKIDYFQIKINGIIKIKIFQGKIEILNIYQN